MSYCHDLSAALALNEKGKKNIKKIQKIIDSKEFRSAIAEAEISGDNDTLELLNSWCNYYEVEVTESLNKLTKFIKLGEEVECRGEDDSHWRFVLTINGWVEQQGHIVYDPENRNIVLCDGEELIVETNAPGNEIYGAIEYKNQRLDEGADEPGGDWKGDFAEMQDYLNKKGYVFKEVGYINHELSTPNEELERYDW